VAFNNAAKVYFKKVGIELLGEELYPIGALTDATPFMQKVKTLNPDILYLGASGIADSQMFLMKKKEFRITTPFLGGGGYLADPSFRQVGTDHLEGMLTLTPSFAHKLTPQEWIKRSLDQCRKEYSDEPWVGQELNYGWTMIPIMAEVLERAGSRDKQAIWKAAHDLDIHNIMATSATSGQGMAFDERGRVVKKYQELLVIQWQKGKPYVVYPPHLASAKPYWPGN
jgi:ABC-type branched-subunit amino acid transport system substrate-binding protein